MRLLFLAVAFSILLSAQQRGAIAGPFNSEYFKLDNGLQVVVIPNHRAPVVIHMMWYRVGSADDPVGKSGIAHFLEHLMFKGTEDLASGEFSRIVARNGGQENAFTSWDYTGYFQRVARDRLEIVMQLEAGRIRGLVLDEEIVRPERDVILEERSARTDNQPSALLSEQIAAAQFLRHPYGTPIIGWRHEIETLDHEDALAFYRRYYAPDNATLIVAGDISAAELKPLAEKYYGVIPAAGVAERRRPSEPPQISPRRVSLRDARVAQPSLTRSYLAPSHASADGDAVALQVFAEILGNKSTSRLYQALVVKRQLAAWAGSSFQPMSLDSARFYVYADALPGVSIAQVEAALDEVIAELLLNGPSEEEVAAAKGRMRDVVVYALDSPQAVASIFGNALSVGLRVEDVESWPERVAAVTRQRIMAAARAVLRLELSVTGMLLPVEGG
ncbi:MAG: pitrilysin family protein [Alphaproteobacteria bacterium]|jgi:zinc protease|nr:pitrilysin family protein [Alphaproteobacteria bacterium]MDP6588323.1 pitrilysin family protein [Alphaproteobacteria bacterium]